MYDDYRIRNDDEFRYTFERLATIVKNECKFKDTRLYDAENMRFSFDNYFHLSDVDKQIFNEKFNEKVNEFLLNNKKEDIEKNENEYLRRYEYTEGIDEFDHILGGLIVKGNPINSINDFIRIGNIMDPTLKYENINNVNEFYKSLYNEFVLNYKSRGETDEDVLIKLFNGDYDTDFPYIIEEIFNKKFEKEGYSINSVEDFIALGDKILPTRGELLYIDDVIEKLRELNPNQTFERVDEFNEREINSSIRMDDPKLKLPEGFYYNEKNGLTNKHNTRSGRYASIKVNVLEKEKLKEETEKESETSKVVSSPKTTTEPKVKTSLPKVPFYKKAIDVVNKMPYGLKLANSVSLGVFGALTVFNAIGGGGLFYVAATIGLPIPVITATVYAGRAIYKSYKSGKIRKWLDRNKEEYEPLPTFEMDEELEKSKSVEPIKESMIDDKDIFFPTPDFMDETAKIEPLPTPEKIVEKTEETPDLVPSKDDKEEGPVVAPKVEETTAEVVKPVFNPKTDLPIFGAPVKKEETTVVEPKPIIEPIVNAYEEPIDNVTYDPSDFADVVSPKVTAEVKEEYKPRHLKKNMQNLEEGYKERRISELESEIAKTNNEIKEYDLSLNILNQKPIFDEDEKRKIAANNMINDFNTKKENASIKLSNMQKELNELKGVKEDQNLASKLKSRKRTLTAKLAKLQDTKENEELRNNIKAAISEIDRYINLDKQIRNNPLATDADRKKLEQVESTTYMAVEYVLDETKNTTRRRGK